MATLGRRYRAGELSPVEATEAVFRRIEGVNEAVNAYCLVDPEAALGQARASERRYREGVALGPLDGIPLAVKDVFLTRGWPTLKGSRAIDPDQPWEEDSPAVARLREAGAVFLGKTTTPELGWKGVTDSPLTGVTGNPWDPSRTAGGSSGGSAAAVVLGMGYAALGTDGGGSIRIPSGLSGLVGLKPTFGRIPHYPPSPFGTLVHAGPMTRTAKDAALLMDVLTRPDRRDWRALPLEGVEYSGAVEGGVKGLRVAASPTLGFAELHPEVAVAFHRAVYTFEELGAHVEETDPGFDDPLEYFDILWCAGAAAALEGFPDEQRAVMDPRLLEIAEAGRSLTAVDYVEASSRRDELGMRMSRFHEEWDLLLTPTLPIPAFEAARNVPEGWPDSRWESWTPFTYPFNLTQQPAASVPCGFTGDGLPIGLQIVGDRFSDALVLRAAHAYQTAHSLTDRRPDL